MKPGGFVGVVQLLDGRGGVGVADRLIAQLFQNGRRRFPITNPLADTLFFHLVHGPILPQAVHYR